MEAKREREKCKMKKKRRGKKEDVLICFEPLGAETNAKATSTILLIADCTTSIIVLLPVCSYFNQSLL